MGGTIALESRAGSGTEIRIDLPSHEGLPGRAGSAEADPSPGARSAEVETHGA
jgi:hypothetical protein